MRCKVKAGKLYVEDATPQELSWLKKKLTWYEREGTLANVGPGDLVSSKPGKGSLPRGIYKVVELNGKMLRVKSDQGKIAERMVYQFFRVMPVKLYGVDDGGVHTYAGLAKVLQEHAPFDIQIDKSESPKAEKFVLEGEPLPGITLEPDQRAAIEKCFTRTRGLVIMPTGAGKTIVQLALIKAGTKLDFLKRCLIVVPSVALAEQFKQDAYNVGYSRNEIGMFHGKAKEVDCRTIVAVMPSIINAIRSGEPWMKLFLQNLSLASFDEGHHLRCDTMHEIVDAFHHVPFLFGFSGSPFLSTKPFENSGDMAVWGLTGGPIFSISSQYLLDRGRIAKPVIHMKQVGGPPARHPSDYNRVYQADVVQNDDRNNIIAKYAHKFVKLGFQVLILCQRLEHAEKVLYSVRDLKAVCIFGGGKGLYFSDIDERVPFTVDYKSIKKNFENGVWNVCIGSTVFDEGMDVPTIGAVIMAGAGSSRIKNLQRLGRGLRRKKVGANVVLVLDFEDKSHVFLASQSKKRRALYEESAADIIESEAEFNHIVHEIADELKWSTKRLKKDEK